MNTNPSPRNRQSGTASTWVYAGFAAVALFFLLSEHRAHLYGWLPYILLAACPLMHLFHGHGGHSNHGRNDQPHRGDERAPTGTAPNPGGPVPPGAHHRH